MRIVADENIALVREAFADLGEVIATSGRAMTPETVRDADILLVRSVTRVDAKLLEGSKVQFVGSPTIGEDHIDKTYLSERNIGFANAPGSNAESVAEYLAAALLQLAEWREFDPATRRLGIIGHGNVGKRVERVARSLGMECVINDPPLQRETGDPKYAALEEAQRCDIIAVHVPLTKTGPDATAHMVNSAFLERCKTGAVFINTSRGGVVDGNALRIALESGKIGASVLDVFENEPNIDTELLANCAIGTAHIAGYSYDGKVAGTRMVYEAACVHFGRKPAWDTAPLLLQSSQSEPLVLKQNDDPYETVRHAVRAVYDIREDDKALRKILTMPVDQRGPHFDALRRDYPRRREFASAMVRLSRDDAAAAGMLKALGFNVSD